MRIQCIRNWECAIKLTEKFYLSFRKAASILWFQLFCYKFGEVVTIICPVFFLLFFCKNTFPYLPVHEGALMIH